MLPETCNSLTNQGRNLPNIEKEGGEKVLENSQ